MKPAEPAEAGPLTAETPEPEAIAAIPEEKAPAETRSDEAGSAADWAPEAAGAEGTAEPARGTVPSPQERLAQAALYDHYARLREEEKALQKEFPDFRLEEALKDTRFLRMTAPGSGLTAEYAYYALHHRELRQAGLEAAAREAEQKITSAVAANRARPRENGSTERAGFVPDYRSMSRAQREELKERIHRAAARGEKLYPGDAWN